MLKYFPQAPQKAPEWEGLGAQHSWGRGEAAPPLHLGSSHCSGMSRQCPRGDATTLPRFCSGKGEHWTRSQEEPSSVEDRRVTGSPGGPGSTKSPHRHSWTFSRRFGFQGSGQRVGDKIPHGFLKISMGICDNTGRFRKTSTGCHLRGRF